MSLDDFKFIYWMEWAHRMWGRTLGAAFLIPAAVFTARGWVRGPLARRLALLGCAGGGQGLVGWWMVRSGLEEPDQPWDTPRVSPVRLASHLASAFAIYAGLAYTAAQLAWPGPPPALTSSHPAAAAAAVGALRRAAHPLAGLIALTALSGAFVAGLDAGHAYNTWPKMGEHWVPWEDYWAEGGPRGAVSGTAPAQLHHRTLAYVTLASSFATWAAHRRAPGLPAVCGRALAALPAIAAAQAGLGIATLLTHVPPALGTLHQVGALTLLTAALGLIFTVRRGPVPAGLSGVAARVAATAKGV
jgi:cytochrome c oxidase assembly protein subunit 15